MGYSVPVPIQSLFNRHKVFRSVMEHPWFAWTSTDPTRLEKLWYHLGLIRSPPINVNIHQFHDWSMMATVYPIYRTHDNYFQWLPVYFSTKKYKFGSMRTPPPAGPSPTRTPCDVEIYHTSLIIIGSNSSNFSSTFKMTATNQECGWPSSYWCQLWMKIII